MGRGGYGSHAETRRRRRRSTTWYLAEGSTSGDFALFYLLQNPNPTATTVTVRYLLPFGQAPIDRTYTLAADSRTTIPVDDQGAELASDRRLRGDHRARSRSSSSARCT